MVKHTAIDLGVKFSTSAASELHDRATGFALGFSHQCIHLSNFYPFLYEPCLLFWALLQPHDIGSPGIIHLELKSRMIKWPTVRLLEAAFMWVCIWLNKNRLCASSNRLYSIIKYGLVFATQKLYSWQRNIAFENRKMIDVNLLHFVRFLFGIKSTLYSYFHLKSSLII